MPLNFHAVSEQAKRHTQKGRYDKAIELWTEFLDTAPDSDAGNAHNILGDLYLKKKDTVPAIDQFLKASHAFERSGYPLKAIATLKKVIKLEPTRTEVFLRLGDLNARRDMIGNAVEAYLTVVKLMTERDQQEPALELIKRVCVLDPLNIRHRLQVATELFQIGYTRHAMDETINAIDLFLEQGNLEEAERYCRHLLDLDQDYAPAQERIERIAKAGRDGFDADFGGGDSAIDDLFAELDSLVEGTDNTPTFELPTESDASDDDPLTAPDPLLGLDDDSPFAEFDEQTMQADTADLRQLAFKHLDAGEFEVSLEKFDQFVTESIAAGEYQEADAALKAYIAIDPDNPVAQEVRLRIYQGRDPEMEREILETLITLWTGVDEGKASHFDQQLAALNDPNANSDHSEALDITDPFADALELSGTGDTDLSAKNLDTTPAGDDELVFNIPGLDGGSDGGHMLISLDEEMLTDDDQNARNAGADTPSPENGSESTADRRDDITVEPSTEDEAASIFSFSLDTEGADGEAAPSADDSQPFELQPDPAADSTPEADDAEPENLFRIQLDDDAPDAITNAVEQAADHGTAPSGPPSDDDASPFAISLDLEDQDSRTEWQIGIEPEMESPASFAPEQTTNAASGDLLKFQAAMLDEDEPAPADDPFDLKEALAEAAFYAHQNLTDEAIGVYRRILQHHPGHDVATARLADLGDTPATPVENAPQAATPERTDWKPMPPMEAEITGNLTTSLGSRAITQVRDDDEWDGGDEFSDFASEVEEAIERTDNGLSVSEDSQLSEILTAFKDGIKAQVGDEDSETHYDLGVAYREMGLLEDAVGEFQMAIKGVLRHADACISLAECFSELGRDHLAVGHLRRALERPDNGPDQWVALAYELASALEKTGETGEAKRLYEEVYARDIGFRDVAEKVSRLN